MEFLAPLPGKLLQKVVEIVEIVEITSAHQQSLLDFGNKLPGKPPALLQFSMPGSGSCKLCTHLGVAQPCCSGSAFPASCNTSLEAWLLGELSSAPMGGQGGATHHHHQEEKPPWWLCKSAEWQMTAWHRLWHDLLKLDMSRIEFGAGETQELEPQIEALQCGYPVEVTAETGLHPRHSSKKHIHQKQCERSFFSIDSWIILCPGRRKSRTHAESRSSMSCWVSPLWSLLFQSASYALNGSWTCVQRSTHANIK